MQSFYADVRVSNYSFSFQRPFYRNTNQYFALLLSIFHSAVPNCRHISRLLSHRSINFYCLLTMPQSRSQTALQTWDECHSGVCQFVFVLDYFGRCDCRGHFSVCILGQDAFDGILHGASNATCEFTCDSSSHSKTIQCYREPFLFLPSALSSVCHVKAGKLDCCKDVQWI